MPLWQRTVQSATVHGPPVSAMMLAFTDMMYAICLGGWVEGGKMLGQSVWPQVPVRT